ncbi:MAG: hypothetical protein QNJ97_24790 [Myxococcota bacterium]|nr:hypothetical protein [Myxococcota bacterium]
MEAIFKRKTCKTAYAAIILVSIVSFNSSSFAYEAYAITEASLCSADCGGSWSTSYASSWINEMNDMPGWTQTCNDCTIFAEEIHDSAHWSSGIDHLNRNMDDGDAMLLVTHGHCVGWDGTVGDWDNCLHWRSRLTTAAGHYDYPPYDAQCYTSSFYMLWGDDDAESVHTLSCNSAQLDLIIESFFGRHPSLDGKLHQFGGWHGTSNSKNYNKVDDFAAASAISEGDPIAWAWLENLTYFNAFPDAPPGSRDLCPVSITHGHSIEDVYNRRDNESYYNMQNYSDPPTMTYEWSIFAYSRCDPPNGLAVWTYF